MKKKFDKENLFIIVLIFALVVIFIGLFTYGLNSVLAMEGSFPPNILTDGITPVPQNNEEALDFLNRTLDMAIKEKPKLEGRHHFDLNADSISTTGTNELKTMLCYAVGEFDSQLDGNFEGVSTDFGQDIANKLNIPAFSSEDITDFKCEYIYYACASCGNESDVPKDSCEICGSIYPYNMKYRNEYTVTLTIAINDNTLENNFYKRTNDEAVALCGDTLTSFASINKIDIAYNELKIVYKVERLTNKLTFLEYSKLMHIDTDVNMLGNYERIGEINTSFDITEYDGYNFTWAGISLSADEITVDPKGTNNLLATLTCTDPLSATVTWKSSDESIVTVDDEGYFDAGKNLGEAKITASFEFDGKTYTDECVIKVKYSVESSKMNDKNITLNVGESRQLNVTVLPKNSTVKTVTWYSENEDIAVVDENGNVTAKSAGTVTVYSLTDDGYFKSSCEVTVK